MQEKLSKEVPVNIAADESKKVILFDKPAGITPVYFLKLELKDDSGKLLSSNFYWLSVKGDEKADFTDLNKLPKVDLKYTVSSLQKSDGKCTLTLDVENPSSSLAFSVNPKILKDASGDLVTPVFWDDNYFSLLPKEKRTLKVQFNSKDLEGEKAVFKIDGWNINPATLKIKQ